MSVLVALFYGFVSLAFGESIIIDTKLGKIEGTKNNGISVFKKIGYAEPPINELRWQPTVPLKNATFNGVHNGTAFGNACIQTLSMAVLMTNNATLSEDCLYLNIFTPYNFDDKNDKIRKVMFWIHGGGLSVGASNTYNASKLAKYKDTVVVTINYRLGVGAFLINPESKIGTGGANAFLDMIEALKWVKNNIESYGGNPDEVTIFGESGGGWGVCGLVMSPLARGLFKRSIQMSGSCVKSLGKWRSKEEAYELSKTVKDSVGAKTFQDLKAMSLQTIVDTFAMTLDFMYPSIDGYVFPESAFDIMNAGYINGESTMIGTTVRESFTEKPFNLGKPPQNETELYDFYYKFLYDSQVDLVKEYYPFNSIDKIYTFGKSEFDSNPATLIQTQLATDCWVRCGTLKQAQIISDNNKLKNSFDVYFYQYGYYTQPYDQVSHGYDVLGLFGFDAEWLSGGATYYDELEKMTMDMFGDYANGIKPTINDEIATYNNGYYMELAEEIKIKSIDNLNALKKRCELYDKLGDGIFVNPFCFGYDAKDISNYPIPDMDETATTNDATNASNDDGKKEL
mmetsp:Transcript_49124/g.60356  ORF Transcript_49124/g.60356 Transcript_49124/m.60356 type:complete len:568 (-) Transcript_49124:143-1846(-)